MYVRAFVCACARVLYRLNYSSRLNKVKSVHQMQPDNFFSFVALPEVIKTLSVSVLNKVPPGERR